MTITNARGLHSHLNANLMRYLAELTQLDKATIIGMAAEISNMQDTYCRLVRYDFDDFEMGRLLDIENPLEAVAEEWRDYLNTYDDDDFTDFLSELLDDDEFFGEVPIQDLGFRYQESGGCESACCPYKCPILREFFVEAAEDYLKPPTRG